MTNIYKLRTSLPFILIAFLNVSCATSDYVHTSEYRLPYVKSSPGEFAVRDLHRQEVVYRNLWSDCVTRQAVEKKRSGYISMDDFSGFFVTCLPSGIEATNALAIRIHNVYPFDLSNPRFTKTGNAKSDFIGIKVERRGWVEYEIRGAASGALNNATRAIGLKDDCSYRSSTIFDAPDCASTRVKLHTVELMEWYDKHLPY